MEDSERSAALQWQFGPRLSNTTTASQPSTTRTTTRDTSTVTSSSTNTKETAAEKEAKKIAKRKHDYVPEDLEPKGRLIRIHTPEDITRYVEEKRDRDLIRNAIVPGIGSTPEGSRKRSIREIIDELTTCANLSANFRYLPGRIIKDWEECKKPKTEPNRGCRTGRMGFWVETEDGLRAVFVCKRKTCDWPHDAGDDNEMHDMADEEEDDE